MLRLAIAVATTGILAASGFGQQGRPQRSPSNEQSPTDSVVKIKGLNGLTITPKGTVYVFGYHTKLLKGHVVRSAYFWRIENQNAEAFKFEECGRIDKMQWLSETSGWAISSGCGAFVSSDSGVSWRKLYFSNEVSASELFFLNPQTAWYFNREAELTRYRDGKFEKFSQSAGFRVVKRLLFVDPDNGWQFAVADGKSQLLTSKDGGKSWVPSLVPNVTDLVDFQLAGANHGFAITSHALYSNSDVEAPWRKIREIGEGDWFDRMFVSHEHVWTQGRVMCRSRLDGTKSVCSAMPERILNENIKSFIFRGGLNGWILTDEGLYRSDDGSSWHRQMLNFGKVRF